MTSGRIYSANLSASEEEKAAACKFLEYLASDAYASAFFRGTGYFATTKSSLEYGKTKEAIENDPNYAVMIDQMQYIKRRPWSASWREI